MGLLIIGLIMFVLLVVVHEYGHFLVAKRNGVEVEEFGIGFPPKLFGKKLGKGIFEGYYTINLLPLGGFVRLKGEHDADTENGTFGAASTSAKTRIMLAGVLVNFVTALLLFTVVAWVGMPRVVDNQFTIASDTKLIRSDVFAGYVDEGSPAAKAGFLSGDQIVKVGTFTVTTKDEMRAATKALAGASTDIVYVRKGETRTASVTLLSEKEVAESNAARNPKGYLGIVPSEYRLTRNTWSAPIVAVGLSGQFTWLTIKGIGSALANLFKAMFSALSGNGSDARKEASAAGENVSGPVGIFVILREGARLGYQFVLFVIALISLTLAIMNFLPIPALDGGRTFVMLLYRAMKRPLLPETEEKIHGTGFAVLMVLFVLITVVDVKRFF